MATVGNEVSQLGYTAIRCLGAIGAVRRSSAGTHP